MASILVVCTGNVCRSPIAEGALRAALAARLGDRAPAVSSAGTTGWEGSPAMPESVEAAADRGLDISAHTARHLLPEHVGAADLVLGMAAEHREAVARAVPDAAPRTFTLKELVRLLASLPEVEAPETLQQRVTRADALRRDGFVGNPRDEDIVDPLGQPVETYRAIAWEIDEWCGRLAAGLAGEPRSEAPIATEGA